MFCSDFQWSLSSSSNASLKTIYPETKQDSCCFLKLPSTTCTWLLLIPLGWRWRWSDLSFTLWPLSGKNFTLPFSCLGSLLQLLWIRLLLLLLQWLQNYTDRGYQGAAEVKHWTGLLLSSSEGSTWVTSCSHPIDHLNFGGPSKSGRQNRVSAYYVSLFLSLFMSLFVMWFVELCLFYCPPSLVWCCVSTAIHS